MKNIFQELKEEVFTEKIVFLNPNSRSRSLVPAGQPLGLMTLMGVCRDLSIPYGFIEADARNMSDDEVIAAIRTGGYDHVGIPLVSLGAVKLFPFLQRIKRETQVSLIVGGPLPTTDTRWMMETCPAVDYAVLGEGEGVLPLLLRALQHGKRLDEIPGLSYRENSSLVINERKRGLIPGAELPMPDFDILDYTLYPGSPPVGAWPSVNLFASRGCPFKCTFCSNPVWGHKPNPVPVDRVLQWIEILASKGVKEIFFVDDTFNIDHGWFEKLCSEIIKRHLNEKMIFKCLFRAHMTFPEQLQIAKKAGFWLVCYGAESGDEELLKYYRKGETVEEIAQALQWTNDAGLKSLAAFIAGAPIDTGATMRVTAEFICRTEPTYIPFSLLHPFMGTEIATDVMEKGILTSDEIRNYDHTRHTIRTQTLSTTELLEMITFIRKNYQVYKKSDARCAARRNHLKKKGLGNAEIDDLIAFEILEAEALGEHGMPTVRLMDTARGDMDWMPDQIEPFSADIRLKEDEWHESERELRWSRGRFELPFFLKEEKTHLEIHWASMREGVAVTVSINGDYDLTLKVTDPGWRVERIELPGRLKGRVWAGFMVADPFFAPNDPRELGMAVKKICFV